MTNKAPSKSVNATVGLMAATYYVAHLSWATHPNWVEHVSWAEPWVKRGLVIPIAFVMVAIVVYKAFFFATGVLLSGATLTVISTIRHAGQFSVASCADSLKRLGDVVTVPDAAFVYGFVPLLFTAMTLTPYDLAREIGGIAPLRVLVPLMSILTWREIAIQRFTVIAELLQIRGLDISSRWLRLKRARLWLLPLSVSLIQGAGYRAAYMEMLAASVVHFKAPVRDSKVVGWQKAWFAILVALVAAALVL